MVFAFKRSAQIPKPPNPTSHPPTPPPVVHAVADAGFTLGSIDEIQKLHKQTVPLGEMPRRLAHLPSVACFGVLTVRFSATPSGEEVRRVVLSGGVLAGWGHH